MIAKATPHLPIVSSLLALTLPWLLALFHWAGPIPADLGLDQGELRPCTGPAHCALTTWPVQDVAATMEALETELRNTAGVHVVTSDPASGYLHATATSRLFGFVDDVEVHSNPQLRLIEARSESRLGDSDLGVNARRLEQLATALTLPNRP